jgi:hypothetical protein
MRADDKGYGRAIRYEPDTSFVTPVHRGVLAVAVAEEAEARAWLAEQRRASLAHRT